MSILKSCLNKRLHFIDGRGTNHAVADPAGHDQIHRAAASFFVGKGTAVKVLSTVLAGNRKAEDKKNPLSDESLAKALTADGIKCARRTVAKYRESLNIPGAANRRIK